MIKIISIIKSLALILSEAGLTAVLTGLTAGLTAVPTGLTAGLTAVSTGLTAGKNKTKQNKICIYVYMVVILGVILGEFRILNFGN